MKYSNQLTLEDLELISENIHDFIPQKVYDIHAHQGSSVPFRYNDIDSFDASIEKLSGNLAAVVMEPMRSHHPEPKFIEHIVQTCRSKEIVLIVDEITSGLRYGFPGAHLYIGLQPDIVVYPKAMSNGIPFGAIVEKMEISGMPPSPSITFHLGDLAMKVKTLYIQKMVKRGFLVSTYFYLMLTHTKDHLSAVLKTMDAIFGGINSLIETGGIDDALSANKNKSGFARLA